MKKIGNYAFARCDALEKVQICEGVLEIGERAFRDCGSLREIHIPKSVECLMTATKRYAGMGNEVFSGCPELTVYCPAGSRAEAYCKEKRVRFKSGGGV